VGHRARRGRAIKVIWDAHEIYEEVAQGDAEHRERNRRLLRDNCSGVDGFVTINDSIANFYREKYPSLPAATIVKNATVPIEPVTYDGRLHAAAALPLEQSVVLYQGGFAEKRGLRDLVAAARYLDSRWTLVMMGWGRIEGELKAVGNEVNGARADRAYPAVVFIPAAPQAELPMWTAGALVGLIPYERTGLNHLYCTPNKLWEYPNANVPILCSPLVEMTKVIEENGVGWLLPETSTPEAIAEVINGLSDEDLTRAREACASYIARDNWSTYEGALLGLYERILAREAA
jgi:glycosyltransferase involved in cell wall biosynthesis